MPAVEVEGLVKRYEDTTAIDGVSLHVDGGEVVALIGPNGAGKTTTVRCLTGTATPTAGTARVLDASPSAVDSERLGVLPQNFRPPERLTALELVRYYAGLYRDARAPDEVLDAVDLASDARDRRYRALSGGQQRRVCVAAAIVNDPDVLFLDEPTTGIDPAGRRALWRLVRDRAGDGAAVFLTTHDMEEAAELADRVALIDDGRIVASGEPDELVDRHGGAPVLEVVPTDPATVDADALDAERRDGGLRFDGVTSHGIQEVLAAVEDAGVDVEAVRWHRPTLDDVFLSLAGDEGGGRVGPGRDWRRAGAGNDGRSGRRDDGPAGAGGDRDA